MKDVKRTMLIIWPVVIAVVLFAGACSAKYKAPVNGQANPALAVSGGGAAFGSVDSPPAASAPASEHAASYQGSAGVASRPVQYNGYPSDRVNMPKRYKYVDGTTCPPMQARPRR